MKKVAVFIFLLAVLVAGVNSEELLIGTAYILDAEGRVLTYNDMDEEDFPTLQMLELREGENEGEGLLYYAMGYDAWIEQVEVIFPETDIFSDITTVIVVSDFLGTVTFSHSGEVLADELWAEMASYHFVHNQKRYTAVGVVAAEDFQTTEEEQQVFREIIGEVRGEYQEEAKER